MKNAFFTKTLLCGVMATTFFLINCQKAPSRGVKATGNGATAVAQNVSTECSDDFAAKFKTANDAVNDLKQSNVANLTDDQKVEIVTKEKATREKIDTAFAALPANATACKTKAGAVYDKRSLVGEVDKVNRDLENKGIKTEGLADTKARDQQREKTKAERETFGFEQGMAFTVSEDLAAALNSANVGAVYFKEGGEIIASAENLKADKENRKLSLCELASGTGDVEKGATLKAVTFSLVNKDVKVGRIKASVIMMAGSVPVNLECLIADDFATKPHQAIRKVFSTKLENKKPEEKKPENAEQAKAILAKKQIGVDTATKGVENAKKDLAAIDEQLSAATDNSSKVKLSEQRATILSRLYNAEKELETATKQKQEAEEALKKLEAVS